MGLESDIALLGNVPVFADMSREQLRLLAFGAEHRWLSDGETLFREEARADGGFVVVSGEILLMSRDRSRVLAVAPEGALIGELSLIAETRRHSTAVARGETEVIRIGRQLFRRLLEEFPDIAASIQATLAAELIGLTARIDTLSPYFDAPDEDEDEDEGTGH